MMSSKDSWETALKRVAALLIQENINCERVLQECDGIEKDLDGTHFALDIARSVAYTHQGEFGEATEALLNVEAHRSQCSNPLCLSSLGLYLLSLTSLLQERFEDALRYIDLYLGLKQNSDDISGLSRKAEILLCWYESLSNDDEKRLIIEAIKLLQKADSLLDSCGDEVYEHKMLRNLIETEGLRDEIDKLCSGTLQALKTFKFIGFVPADVKEPNPQNMLGVITSKDAIRVEIAYRLLLCEALLDEPNTASIEKMFSYICVVKDIAPKTDQFDILADVMEISSYIYLDMYDESNDHEYILKARSEIRDLVELNTQHHIEGLNNLIDGLQTELETALNKEIK